MKMKLLDRLILRFGAALTLVTGGISVAAGILLFGRDLGEGVVMRWLPLALIISGAVAVIISALNLLVARRYASRRRAFITQPNEMGELRIAVSAIENLIQKCVEMHKEVKVTEMNVTNHRGAIDVDMRVSMNSNVSIPHAVEQLQSQIKRYLAASSGIEVHNIRVSVDKAPGSDDALPREPLTDAVKTEKPAEEKEKIPMHQRIFGRDPEKSEAEQVVEAEMVTPPETEPETPAETEPETEKAPAEEEPAAEEAEPAPEAEDAELNAEEAAPADEEEKDE